MIQLGQLLDHNMHAQTELQADQREADVFAVLVAIADHDRTAPRHRQHRHQLGLGTGFEAKAVRAGGNQLAGDAALLVHLDRIDGRIAACIAVIGNRLGECVLQPRQAVGEDVGKAHQQRQAQAVGAGALDDLRQREGRAVRATRAHHDLTGGVHIHIAVAPVRHGIGVAGRVGVPMVRHQRCSFYQRTMQSQRRALTVLLQESTSPSDRKPRTPRGRSDLSAADALRRPCQGDIVMVACDDMRRPAHRAGGTFTTVAATIGGLCPSIRFARNTRHAAAHVE